jgi:hypothetical protein
VGLGDQSGPADTGCVPGPAHGSTRDSAGTAPTSTTTLATGWPCRNLSAEVLPSQCPHWCQGPCVHPEECGRGGLGHRKVERSVEHRPSLRGIRRTGESHDPLLQLPTADGILSKPADSGDCGCALSVINKPGDAKKQMSVVSFPQGRETSLLFLIFFCLC